MEQWKMAQYEHEKWEIKNKNKDMKHGTMENETIQNLKNETIQK